MRGRLTGPSSRRGGIAVLGAAMLVMIFAFAAFTVDLGYIALTRTQLQNAADAAALAACTDLLDALGNFPTRTASQATAQAQASAVSVAASNRGGERSSVYVDPQADIEFGRATWNAAAGKWQVNWGNKGPFTAVRITVTRGQRRDGLPLFFAPVIGSENATIRVQATAAVTTASVFRIVPGSPTRTPVLPFTCDLASWQQLLKNGGSDSYKYNPGNGVVSGGADGTPEINIYPGSKSLPSGNRGSVSLGSPGSSTGDLRQWIVDGMSDSDMQYFGGQLSNDQCPIAMDGATGVKGGMEGALESIIGQPRVMPLFSTVSGAGTNSTYTIVQFVGVRIMAVNLSGGTKSLIVQPATVADETAVPDSTATSSDFYTVPRLVN